jgi:hypothetical protein
MLHDPNPKFKHSTPSRFTTRARRTPLLSPNLIEALKGLAAVEDVPVPTLIALLINEALDQRLRCRS